MVDGGWWVVGCVRVEVGVVGEGCFLFVCLFCSHLSFVFFFFVVLFHF